MLEVCVIAKQNFSNSDRAWDSRSNSNSTPTSPGTYSEQTLHRQRERQNGDDRETGGGTSLRMTEMEQSCLPAEAKAHHSGLPQPGQANAAIYSLVAIDALKDKAVFIKGRQEKCYRTTDITRT